MSVCSQIILQKVLMYVISRDLFVMRGGASDLIWLNEEDSLCLLEQREFFPVLLRWVGCPSCSQWVRSRSSQRCAIQLRYAPPNMWEQMLQIMLPFFLLFPPPPVCFCFLSRVKSKCLFFGWAYVVTGWSLHDARVPNGTATCPRESKFITGWWWSAAEILQDWGKIRRRKCRITQWLTDDKAVLAH